MSEAVAEILAIIARELPGRPVSYGIDHKGPWATIGDVTARARPAPVDALRAVLAKSKEPVA
jgi:hypothetical protein